ncbi:MAG: hypothetical protein AB7K64_18560 [Variibacter sp.]
MDLSRRQGVDVRPSLLRVLTDLYIQQKRHTHEEERQYAELAVRLLPAVDVPTRVAVATKLAAYPQPPAIVIDQLRRDIPQIAALVAPQDAAAKPDSAPKMSARPTTEELISAIFGPETKPTQARAVATPPATADTTTPVQDHPAESIAETAAPKVTPEIAAAPSETAPETPLGERFLAASAEARLEMLLNMEDEHVPLAAPPRPASADAISRLETAALARKPQEFARELQQLLGLLPSIALQITEDTSGETVLVIARALGMPAAVLQRILIFLNPVIGHSVQRVFALANFYERVSRNAAARIVESWRRDAAQARRTRYAGVHAPDAPERTSALMDHARRGLARTSDTAPQRGEAAPAIDRRQRTT